MRKIRVAYITRGPFGSLGSAASYMLPKVMSTMCDVLVLSPASELLTEEIVHFDDKIKIVPLNEKDGKGRTLEIYRELNFFQPDIIHLFQNPDCLLYLEKLSFAFPDTRWIVDFRSPLLTNRKQFRKKMLRRYFLSQFFAHRIISHSRLTIRDNLPCRFRDYVEIPPGLDLSQFSPQNDVSLLPTKFVFIGSVSKVREIDFLVQAFGKYGELAKRKITLDIIGGGNALSEIQNLIDQNGWDFIHARGALKQEELLSKISSYDIGIAYIPNGKFERAPSLKSLEYAAAGLPILASNTIGHKDYSERFSFQFNFFQNNFDSFSRAINSAEGSHLDDQRRHNLRTSESFDWTKIGHEKLLPIYQSLLKISDLHPQAIKPNED